MKLKRFFTARQIILGIEMGHRAWKITASYSSNRGLLSRIYDGLKSNTKRRIIQSMSEQINSNSSQKEKY